MNQHTKGLGRGGTGDVGHIVWLHVMAFSNLDDRIDRALRAVRTRISLESGAWLQESKILAEFLGCLRRFQRAEEAALLIENLCICRKPHGREFCRHDPVSRCVAKMEGLHHSAKVLA